jgi:hypothetical protein
MKTLVGAILMLLTLGSSVFGGDRSLPPAEDRALAQFTKAAGDAEAAYRETVLGLMKVLGSHLVDAERATVRKGDIEEANRIRIYRDRIARLATEVSRHDFLGGTLPPIDAYGVPVPPTAKERIEVCAGKLSEAEGVYREALKTARSGTA